MTNPLGDLGRRSLSRGVEGMQSPNDVDGFGKDFYKPEMPGLRQAAKKLAVLLGEKTGRFINSVNIHGVTPISLLQKIEDGTANVVGDAVRIGETTVATISF
jgi:hypothetical protein